MNKVILSVAVLAMLAAGAEARENPFIGPAGPQGEQGEQGIQGIQGETGPQGATGAQGIQGIAGKAGTKGATGSQGVAGAKGATGSTGNTGNTGSTGAKGVAGAKGATGKNGVAGAKGVAGATGSTGEQGIAGNDGADGTNQNNELYNLLTQQQSSNAALSSVELNPDHIGWSVGIGASNREGDAAAAIGVMYSQEVSPGWIIKNVGYNAKFYNAEGGYRGATVGATIGF